MDLEPPEAVESSIVDVSSWRAAEPESAGGDEKVWLEDERGVRWLFKPRTGHGDWEQGEDWAERVTTLIARDLGVPVASAELAIRTTSTGTSRGTISRDLSPPGWELQHGSLLLSELLPGFRVRHRDRTGHDVENIRAVLDTVAAPEGFAAWSSFEVFSGYLVLDALVANSDRHEENWAVLRPTPGDEPPHLAPSYDHGSSLGFNLQDRRRALELDRGGVGRWARRARAQRFDLTTDGRLDLVELAHRGAAMTGATATAHWTGAVADLSPERISGILRGVPTMSEVAHMFVQQLLEHNRERLLR